MTFHFCLFLMNIQSLRCLTGNKGECDGLKPDWDFSRRKREHSVHFPQDQHRGRKVFNCFLVFEDFQQKNISFPLCVTVHQPPFGFKGDKDDSNKLQIE